MKMKEQFIDLWNYLDWIHFVDESEVNCAVQDYFMEEHWLLEPSFSELMILWEMAKEYIDDRQLTFN